MVVTPAFEDGRGIRGIDPNNPPFTVLESRLADPNAPEALSSRTIERKPIRITTVPGTDGVYSVRASGLRFDLGGNVYIPVTMPGNRTYWGLVDTGFGHYVYVNECVVRECDLAVYPLGTNRATGRLSGLCEVPTMWIGQTRIENPPCIHEQGYWQFQVLGVPVYRQDVILIGLRLLRAHSYVLFDNPAHRVVFSHREWEPPKAASWICLPFTQAQIDRSPCMLVDLPIGDSTVQVLFDTGGAKPGLRLTEKAWERMKRPLAARDRGRGHYRNIQFGRLPCRRYTVPMLSFGEIEVNDARVNVTPEDNPDVKGFDGVLSLYYFRDTTVVLDFSKNLVWIRKS